MSRIRSVHPGLWTDERFVVVTPLARLLFIGIWNECDDQGAFEWSPLKLKMRLLPADNADAATLLAELQAAGCVMRYEAGGKDLGVVRNFARYQRPKKPHAIHQLSPEAAAFAKDGSEPVRNQFGTEPETDAQRKEEGGRKEALEPDGSNGADAPQATPVDLTAAVWESGVALLVSKNTPVRNARSMIGRWLKDYGDAPVLAVLTDAQLRPIVDPIPWITKSLETKYGKSGSRPNVALAFIAHADQRAAAGSEADWGAGPALPAAGIG